MVDAAGELNAAGILSHPAKLPKIKTNYLGLLSRFQLQQIAAKKYDYCIVLSGPEPQRTILENLILKDLHHLHGTILLVRGKPKTNELFDVAGNVFVQNHLAGNELQQAFEESEYIIARSGYTTVMEILSLQKKAILIPTPGQTEQEYLGDQLHRRGLCFSAAQKDFNLSNAVQQAAQFNYSNILLPVFNQQKLQELLTNL